MPFAAVDGCGTSAVIAGGAALAVSGCALAYRLVWPPRCPVNCHFCNSNTEVGRGEVDGWVCPYCEQYNGFTEDGDYNRPVHHTNNISNTVLENRRSHRPPDNGFCRSCNLNQELKIAQLASFPGEGKELQEYKDHLERVYRLCGNCEEVLVGKLSSQDALLIPAVLEHRLETSRLYSHIDTIDQPKKLVRLLCDSQMIISVLLFFVILNPNINPEWLSLFPPTLLPHVMTMKDLVSSNYLLLRMLLAVLLATVSVCLSVVKPVSLICLAPLATQWLDLDGLVQLTVACVCATLVPLYPCRQAKSAPPRKARITKDSLSAKFIEAEPEDLEETRTTCTSQAVSHTAPLTELVNKTHSLLFASQPASPSGGWLSSPLLRSGEGDSLSHEFVTQYAKDVDLTSLSLGEVEINRPASVESAPFSSRLYSPENSSGIKFSPARPLIRPSRLTSWVAGGYWTPPPDEQIFGQTISRSSSQSSGFVSGSVPSLHNFTLSQPHPFTALQQSSPIQSVYGDCDRCSVLSEPRRQSPAFLSASLPSRHKRLITARRSTMDDDVSDTSIDRLTQAGLVRTRPVPEPSPNTKEAAAVPASINERLSLTVTITPTGILFVASLAVNLCLFYVCFVK